MYDTDFEKVFLSWTGEFYKEEGERLVEDCEAGVYLKKVSRFVSFSPSKRHSAHS